MAAEVCPAEYDVFSIVRDDFAMYAKRELNKTTGWHVMLTGT